MQRAFRACVKARCASFRSTILSKSCVALPGAYNGLTARLAAAEGFAGCYLSGAALSASKGLPDTSLVEMREFSATIKEMADVSGLPVFADADTGFGSQDTIRKSVVEYSTAGAVALHLEDQHFPKRCGHLLGKTLVSVETMITRLQAARAASDFVSDGFFIVCARTDARGPEGMAAAIERAKAYVKAGSDAIFPEGLESVEEFRQFAAAMQNLEPLNSAAPKPLRGPFLLANMTEFGRTPHINLAEFLALGYHVVIYPVSTLRTAARATQEVLRTLNSDGSLAAAENKMLSRQELYELLKYDPSTSWTYPNPTVE